MFFCAQDFIIVEEALEVEDLVVPCSLVPILYLLEVNDGAGKICCDTVDSGSCRSL